MLFKKALVFGGTVKSHAFRSALTSGLRSIIYLAQ